MAGVVNHADDLLLIPRLTELAASPTGRRVRFHRAADGLSPRTRRRRALNAWRTRADGDSHHGA